MAGEGVQIDVCQLASGSRLEIAEVAGTPEATARRAPASCDAPALKSWTGRGRSIPPRHCGAGLSTLIDPEPAGPARARVSPSRKVCIAKDGRVPASPPRVTHISDMQDWEVVTEHTVNDAEGGARIAPGLLGCLCSGLSGGHWTFWLSG